MGTVPLPNGGRLQTWDGVVSGDRLLTMACSDKLLAWNVVGLQGALLSHWLEPVYLSSLTLGSKYIPEHVERALHGRLGQFLPLPPPHRVAQPALLGTTSLETRQPTKAQEFSANWITGRYILFFVRVMISLKGKVQNLWWEAQEGQLQEPPQG